MEPLDRNANKRQMAGQSKQTTRWECLKKSFKPSAFKSHSWSPHQPEALRAPCMTACCWEAVQCLSMYGMQLQELSCQTQHLDDASLHFPAVFTSLRLLTCSDSQPFKTLHCTLRQETPKRATTRWLPEPLQESHKIIQNRHAKALVGHLTWPWNKNLLREPNKSLHTSTSNKDLHGRTPQKISPRSRQDLLTRTLTSSWSGSWHKDLYENIARSSKNDLHKSSKSLTPEPQRVHPARACTQALPTGYLQNLDGRIMKDLSEDFALISIRSPHKDPYKI